MLFLCALWTKNISLRALKGHPEGVGWMLSGLFSPKERRLL